MSVHVTTYVWEHSAHKGAELLLMLAIADIAHRNGVAFPSVKTLAVDFLRMSERQVTRLIQRCEASGELEVRRNQGPHGTHLFRIKMNLTLPLFSEHTGDKLSGDKLSGDKRPSKGVTNQALGGDIAMSPEPTRTKENRKTTHFVLPDWIPEKPWKAWLEVRAKKRAPNTDEALRLSVLDLERFRAAGHAPQAVLEQSIKRAWVGLFAIKPADGVAPVVDLDIKREWWQSDKGIASKREELGIAPGRSMYESTAMVFMAMGPGPWMDRIDSNVSSYICELRDRGWLPPRAALEKATA